MEGLPGGKSGKDYPPARARDVRDLGLIPGLGRAPGGGHGNLFQYSCLENPKERGSWWARVHGVAKSQTGLKWFSTQHSMKANHLIKCYISVDCWHLNLCSSFQKSPAKKLTNALSKSLSCASSREPLHPMFPDQPEKPLNLAHIVWVSALHTETQLFIDTCADPYKDNFLSVVRDRFKFYFLKERMKVRWLYIYILFFFVERYTVLLPVSIRMQHHIIHLKVENIQKFYSYTDVSGVYTVGQ